MNNQELQLFAAKARKEAVSMVYRAASGHPGGALSSADIMTALYCEELRVDPADAKNPGRDRFVLSKGHVSPILYAVLAQKGFFPMEDLLLFRSIEGHMSGHAEMHINGVDMSTGSLGQGISAAVGMALAAKLSGADYRCYALLGDGEIAEGQVWEAMASAAKYKLDNFLAIVDVNGLQIDGRTADVMPMEPLDKKFESFGAHVIKIDGHDFEAIRAAFAEAKAVKGQPSVILAKTIKGKGVSFMEDNADWHGKAPNAEQYATAMAELDAVIAKLNEKEA